jgi:ankyrin repeat protein
MSPKKHDFRAQLQRERLHSAAQAGDVARVRALLDAKYPVNRFDQLGKTPLHCAVEGEHFEVVDMLLHAGAHVNAHDERVIGDTPLGKYAGTCSYKMAKRLVDAGADPSIPGWMSLTALHRAAMGSKRPGGEKVLRLLKQVALKNPASDVR